MSRPRSIQDSITEAEYTLAKYKAVQKVFPTVKVNYYMEFSSKSVNQNYTKFDFERRYNGLYVVPYAEVFLLHDDKEEIIKIHSAPRRNKLVHLTYERHEVSKKRIMRFARMSINMKNNNFKDEMLNSCKAEIMNFIKDNPGFHLDTKHLEPRLKKLMIFT